MNDNENENGNENISSMPEIDSKPLTVGHLRKWEFYRSRSQTNMARTLYALIGSVILILGALGTYMTQSFVSQQQFLEYRNDKNKELGQFSNSLKNIISESIEPIRTELNNLRGNLSEIRFVLNSEKFITSERFLDFKEQYLSLKEATQQLDLKFSMMQDHFKNTWSESEQENFVKSITTEINRLNASLAALKEDMEKIKISVAKRDPSISEYVEN